MKKWSHEKKRGMAVIAAMLGALALLGGILFDMLSPIWETPAPDTVQLKRSLGPSPSAVPAREASLGQQSDMRGQARLGLLCRFSRCGHCLYPEAPSGLSGLTEAELTALGYQPEKTENGLSLSCTVEGYCPAHLLLCFYEGEIAVIQRNSSTLENQAIWSRPLLEETLDPIMQSELAAGVEIHSMAEINAYLEAAES